MKQIDEVSQNLEKRITQNFSKVSDILLNPYNWPLLDSIRQEICNCILIDSSQAAVTLTNHLLEKSLKAVLMYNEPNNQNYTEASEIEQHFENMNNQFGGIVLYKTISACHEKKLITDEQSQKLHKFREIFRNAFGHADPKKLFGETKKVVGIFNPFVHAKVQSAEVKVANFPFLQDTTQKQISDNECVNYFRYVDGVIRGVMPKLFMK